MSVERKDKIKKRIIVLTSTYPRWASDEVPAFVAYLCHELRDEYEVHVLAPHYSGAKLSEELDGVHVERFVYSFPSWERLAYGGGIMENIKENRMLYLLLPFFFLSQFVALCRMSMRFQYVLIHAHWLIPQGLTAVMFRWLSHSPIPLVVTSHGGDLFALNGSLMSKVKKLVLEKAEHVAVVSHVMKSTCESIGIDKNRISVLPMGVDLRRRFVPSLKACGGNDLVYVGRLVEKKGVSVLITAVAILAESNDGVHLLVVGDGPMRAELERQRDALLLKKHITFVGSLQNSALPVILRKASIAIIPSIVAKSGDQEGLGLVTIEAMGCGCAVVASDLPAIRDVVIHGETGLLAEPGVPEDLADKIAILIENREFRDRIARAGRESVVRKYDWATVGLAYGDLIEDLCVRYDINANN